MKEQELIKEDQVLLVETYLNGIYAAGYEQGNKDAYCNNPNRIHTEVLQWNGYRHLIKKYGSAAEAARENNCSVDTIFRAMKEGRITQWGYFTRVTSEETTEPQT